MRRCGLISTCVFYNTIEPHSRQVMAIYRARYCKGEFAECARYLLANAVGQSNVPASLHPTDRLEAMKLVRHAHNEQRKRALDESAPSGGTPGASGAAGGLS